MSLLVVLWSWQAMLGVAPEIDWKYIYINETNEVGILKKKRKKITLAQSLFFLLVCLSVCLISSVHHFLPRGESFLFIVMLCTVVGEVPQALSQYRETTSYSVYSSQFYFAQQTKQQQQNQHSHNRLMHGYVHSAAQATKKAHSR